jgi:hypothetical protein
MISFEIDLLLYAIASTDDNDDGFWDRPYTIYKEIKDYYPLGQSIKL